MCMRLKWLPTALKCVCVCVRSKSTSHTQLVEWINERKKNWRVKCVNTLDRAARIDLGGLSTLSTISFGRAFLFYFPWCPDQTDWLTDCLAGRPLLWFGAKDAEMMVICTQQRPRATQHSIRSSVSTNKLRVISKIKWKGKDESGKSCALRVVAVSAYHLTLSLLSCLKAKSHLPDKIVSCVFFLVHLCVSVSCADTPWCIGDVLTRPLSGSQLNLVLIF